MFENLGHGFDVALGWLREGQLVTRKSWSLGTFVVLQQGYPQGIGINANTASATGIPEGTVCAFKPYLMRRTEDGAFIPWTPSQEEVLATDWTQAKRPALAPGEGLDYREAMQIVMGGERVSRHAWANHSVIVFRPSTEKVPYLRLVDGRRIIWVPTERDRNATDWYISAWSE